MDVAGRFKLPRFSALVAIKTTSVVYVKPGKFDENFSVFQIILDITRSFSFNSIISIEKLFYRKSLLSNISLFSVNVYLGDNWGCGLDSEQLDFCTYLA